MPRKSKLTQKLVDEAAELIRNGNYANVACRALGISETSWYNWLKDAENENTSPLKRVFFEAIKEAEAQAERDYLEVIKKASDKHWQAAAWWLERKFPDKWGRFQRVEHEFKGGVLVVPEQQSADEWEAVVKRGAIVGGNGSG